MTTIYREPITQRKTCGKVVYLHNVSVKHIVITWYLQLLAQLLVMKTSMSKMGKIIYRWQISPMNRQKQCNCLLQLTMKSLNKRGNILQTTFSNAFHSKNIFVFWLKINWNVSLRIQLTTSQHWFRYWHYKTWDEIIYPLPNFNGTAVDVWEWKSNFIPHLTGHVVTCPYWD